MGDSKSAIPGFLVQRYGNTQRALDPDEVQCCSEIEKILHACASGRFWVEEVEELFYDSDESSIGGTDDASEVTVQPLDELGNGDSSVSLGEPSELNTVDPTPIEDVADDEATANHEIKNEGKQWRRICDRFTGARLQRILDCYRTKGESKALKEFRISRTDLRLIRSHHADGTSEHVKYKQVREYVRSNFRRVRFRRFAHDTFPQLGPLTKLGVSRLRMSFSGKARVLPSYSSAFTAMDKGGG